MFHLFTHAFFKALLFLAAGSVMHAMGNVIDMRRFGGLRKLHADRRTGPSCAAPWPWPACRRFSGFWSKDEILGAAFERRPASRLSAPSTCVLFVAGDGRRRS